MKDPKVVNFMYRTLKPNETGLYQDTHPFVSFCGKEINYVSPVDRYSPFCFKELLASKDEALFPVSDITEFCNSTTENLKLVYGADMMHSFEVDHLFYHPTSGRIYHEILTQRYLNGRMGLLHPFLAQKLASLINWDPSSECYTLEWLGGPRRLQPPPLRTVGMGAG